MLSQLNTWDWAALRAINLGLGHDALDPLMRFISYGGLWWAIGLIFLGIALVRRRPAEMKLAVAIVLAISSSDIVCARILKPTVARPRPCYTETDLRRPAEGCGGRFGFPSNHAANGAAVTTVLALAGTGPWAWTSLVLAFLVGLSRSYLGVHFPGDVIAGFAVGSALGVLVSLFFLRRQLFGKNAGRPLRNGAKTLYG